VRKDGTVFEKAALKLIFHHFLPAPHGDFFLFGNEIWTINVCMSIKNLVPWFVS